MSKRVQKTNSLLARQGPTAPHVRMGHTSINSALLYLNVPDSAPEGMTIAEAQFIWSRAVALYDETELTAKLATTLQNPSPMGELYNEKVSSLDSQTSQSDSYDPLVFGVLRNLSATVPEVEIDDRGSCIVLNKSLWSHLTHHLLTILVMAGEAPESLEELLLQKDLGL